MAWLFSLAHSANKGATVTPFVNTHVCMCVHVSACVQDVWLPRPIHFFISSLRGL